MSSEMYTLRLSAAERPLPPAIGRGNLVAAVAAVAGVAASAAAAAATDGSGRAGALSCVEAEWIHPQVRGTPPPPRIGHCASMLGDDAMVLFGGYAATAPHHKSGGAAETEKKRSGRASSAGGYSNAIFALNVAKTAWVTQRLEPPTSQTRAAHRPLCWQTP